MKVGGVESDAAQIGAGKIGVFEPKPGEIRTAPVDARVDVQMAAVRTQARERRIAKGGGVGEVLRAGIGTRERGARTSKAVGHGREDAAGLRRRRNPAVIHQRVIFRILKISSSASSPLWPL